MGQNKGGKPRVMGIPKSWLILWEFPKIKGMMTGGTPIQMETSICEYTLYKPIS